MPIGDHITSFANRKVELFDPAVGITDPVGTACALRVEWNEYDTDITKQLEQLLQDPEVDQLEALVIGPWHQEMSQHSSSIAVNALVAAQEQLTSLKAVFVGEITYDEFEISWILQSDISPLLAAYPNLEVLQVRGGTDLAFKSLHHEQLKTLIIETGGLSPNTIAQICAGHLPALEHLELWLGSDEYGGNSSVDDLQPILSGNLFPKLTYLGLCDSEYSDSIAKAIVQSPIIEQIEVLDLKLGTLGDEGAQALLNCPAVSRLNTLNVKENYLSEEMIERLNQLNIEVIADEQKEEDEEEEEEYRRYCSVTE
ncbi:MAG: STM4015 family protein [Cyanobacteriota bacterium]